jgi:hypothetical protein
MAFITEHCPVSHANVVRVTDFEGTTLRVICGDYDESTATCQVKSRGRENGPLGRLVEGADEATLGSSGTRCHFA